jgi:two-component system OmpR family response regulator
MAINETPHVLIIDDNREIRETLSRYLERHGYRVATAEDATAGRRILKASAPDLLVLDIMMPGEDGLSFCRHVRETADIPVIFLTAVDEPTDRIIGLEIGADDYVTKPFNPRELLARVKAVLRRAQSLPVDTARRRVTAGRMAFDRWQFDLAQRELIGSDGVSVALSTTEFLLLDAFIRHRNMVLSRDQLLDLTKGRAAEAFDRSIDNQVSRLRRKIELDPKDPAIIKTVWGGGYSFAAEVHEQ